MNSFVLTLHGLLAWLLILALPALAGLAFAKNPLTIKLRPLVLASAHLQLILGLWLYLSGPLGYKLFAQEGVMKNSALRFYAVEHISTMIIMIVLITLAAIRLKREFPETKRSTVFLILGAWLLMLSRVPWDRFPFFG